MIETAHGLGAGSNPDMNLAFDQIFEFAKTKGYTGGDSNSKEFVHFFREGMLNGMQFDSDDMTSFEWNEITLLGSTRFYRFAHV